MAIFFVVFARISKIPLTFQSKHLCRVTQPDDISRRRRHLLSRYRKKTLNRYYILIRQCTICCHCTMWIDGLLPFLSSLETRKHLSVSDYNTYTNIITRLHHDDGDVFITLHSSSLSFAVGVVASPSRCYATKAE